MTHYTFTRTPWHHPGTFHVADGVDLDSPPIDAETITCVCSSEDGPPQLPNPYGADCPWGPTDGQVCIGLAISAAQPIAGDAQEPGQSVTMAMIYVKATPKGIIIQIPPHLVTWSNGPTWGNYVAGMAFVSGIFDINYPHPRFPPRVPMLRPDPPEAGLRAFYKKALEALD